MLLLQQPSVVRGEKLVEGVERGLDRIVRLELREVEVHGVRQSYLLRACRLLGFAFPERQQQGLDRLALLDVVDPVLDIERIEGDGLLLGIGEVDAVASPRRAVDQRAEPLVGVSRIDEQDMRPLFVILADHVVREEGLSAARGPQDEFVAVGGDAALHRKIRDVQMERHPREPVGHLDAEG